MRPQLPPELGPFLLAKSQIETLNCGSIWSFSQFVIQSSMYLSPTAKLIFRFLIHILVGVFLFGAMAAAATVLWYATDVMREHRVPAFICWICELVSELLFFLDVICLLFLMGVEVWKLLRDVWGTLRETGEVNERSQGSS
jgi:hypothetical protein